MSDTTLSELEKKWWHIGYMDRLKRELNSNTRLAIVNAPVLILAPIGKPHDFPEGSIMAFGDDFHAYEGTILSTLPPGKYAVVNLDALTEENKVNVTSTIKQSFRGSYTGGKLDVLIEENNDE